MSDLGIFYPTIPGGGINTANVRINADDGVLVLISCPYISENAINGQILQNQNTSVVYDVPILENGAYLSTKKAHNLECFVTGECEIVEDEWSYVVHITGDCEISLTYAAS